MRNVHKLLTAGLATLSVLAGLSVSAAPVLAAEQWSIVGTFGGASSTPADPEPLSGPAWVAVNQSTKDVYVVDEHNNRVEYFSSTGSYLGQFNGSTAPTGALSAPGAIVVDNSGSASDPSKEDVYVVDTDHQVIDKFSPNGTYLGQLTGTCEDIGESPPCPGSNFVPFHELRGVAVTSSGDVWVISTAGADGAEGGLLQEFSDAANNTPLASLPLSPGSGYQAMAIAVNPEGDLYLLAKGEVEIFNPEGKLIEIVGHENENPTGMSADPPSSKLYVDFGSSVTLTAPVTGTIESLGAGPLTDGGGIAVDPSSGDLYVAEPANNRVFVFERSSTPQAPPPPPSTEAATEATGTSWTLNGKLNPEGAPGGVGYYFSYNAGTGSSCTGPGSVLTPFDSGASNVTGNAAVPVSATVRLRPHEEYAFCLVADKYGATAGPQMTVTTGAAKPEVISESALSVELLKKELVAVINPESEETTYSFEYSTKATGEELEGEVATVEGEAPLPAEFGEPTAAVRFRGGFGETYYYRVVATNGTGTTKGKVQSYTELPAVTGEKFSKLTSTSAKLEATIFPNIEGTAYAFEYATSEEALEQGKGTPVPGGTGTVGENEEPVPPTPVSVELFGLQPGQIYYYRVVATNETSQNPGNINKGKPIAGAIGSLTPYAPPAVTTGESQSVTRTTAVLSGEVNPEGAEASYYFAYIDQAGYEKALAGDAQEKANPYAEGETTASAGVKAGSEPRAISPIPVNGLLPGTTYHYALVATNKFGARGTGLDRTLTTKSSTPPVVSTGGVSGVSQNSATLSGTVSTNGLQTSYGFEIGTQLGEYGAATGLGSVGGSQTEAVSVALGELQPGTTYYYRVTASNADGTSYGEPESFATPGFPTLLAASVELPLIATPGITFPEGSQENTAQTKKTTAKKLTNAQKLTRALKACRREAKSRRAACEKAAHRKYGPAKRKKKK